MAAQTRKPQYRTHIINVSHWHKNDKCRNILRHNMEPFNEAPGKLIEQDAEPVLLKIKKQLLGLLFDEQLLATNPRYTNYCRCKNYIIIKDDMLYRRNYNDVGNVSQLQVLVPMQLKDTIRNSSHAQAGKQPGISKMMPKIRQKHYFSSIENHVHKWVKKR